MTPPIPTNDRETGLVDFTAVVLLLQAALGLVSLLGTVIFAVIAGAPVLFAGSIALALLGVLLPLLFAKGVLHFRRSSRRNVIAYEIVVLLAFAVRLAIGREFAFSLVPLLTGGMVPLLLLGLLLSRTARRAFAKPRLQQPVVVLDTVVINREPAVAA